MDQREEAMEFKQELIDRQRLIEQQIYSFLPEESGQQRILMEAINYSVKAGGKRLRPLLMSEVFALTVTKHSETAEEAKCLLSPFLAAVELIHTYSLVHDDLPAMDNDEFRRGKRTTHAVYGEAIGILTGDGLLNLAYETAAKAFDMTDQISELNQLEFYRRIAKSIQILSDRAGIYGMVGGQTVDVIKSGAASSLDELLFIYQLKTSALLEASVLCGAVLGGGDEEELNQWRMFAVQLGLAFQIRDDILDVTGNMELLGKPVHSDEKNQKTTYVSLCGLDAAKAEVSKRSKQALQIYDSFEFIHDTETDFFRCLVLELITREK